MPSDGNPCDDFKSYRSYSFPFSRLLRVRAMGLRGTPACLRGSFRSHARMR